MQSSLSLAFAKIFLVNYRLEITSCFSWEEEEVTQRHENFFRRRMQDYKLTMIQCKRWQLVKRNRELKKKKTTVISWDDRSQRILFDRMLKASSAKRTRWLFPQVKKEEKSLTLQPGAHELTLVKIVKNCRRQEEMAFRRCHHKINEGFLSRLFLSSLPLRENMFMTLDDMKEIKIPPELVYPILWCRCCVVCCLKVSSHRGVGRELENQRKERRKREKYVTCNSREPFHRLPSSYHHHHCRTIILVTPVVWEKKRKDDHLLSRLWFFPKSSLVTVISVWQSHWGNCSWVIVCTWGFDVCTWRYCRIQ